MRKRVTEGRDMAVAEPPGVVHFVRMNLVSGQLLLPRRRSLELPVIQTVEEHLGQIIHHLPFLGRQVIEFVQHKISHALGNARLLIRRVTQRSLNTRLSSLQDAASQELEQIEVHLLGVLVLLLMNTHEQILHIHDNSQEPVQLLLCSITEVTHMR